MGWYIAVFQEDGEDRLAVAFEGKSEVEVTDEVDRWLWERKSLDGVDVREFEDEKEYRRELRLWSLNEGVEVRLG